MRGIWNKKRVMVKESGSYAAQQAVTREPRLGRNLCRAPVVFTEDQ